MIFLANLANPLRVTKHTRRLFNSRRPMFARAGIRNRPRAYHNFGHHHILRLSRDIAVPVRQNIQVKIDFHPFNRFVRKPG